MTIHERNMSGEKINAVQPFLFEEEHLVRVVDQDDNPWFIAKDICAILGVGNVSKSLEKLDEDEKGVTSSYTLGGNQEVLIVSEGGLYTLILRSRGATTPGTVQHRFRKWVTGEVLPAIRKTGSYGVAKPETPKIDEASDVGMKIRMVNACRPIFGNQAAAQLWFYLDLPDMPAMHPDPRQINLFDYSQIKSAGDEA
ncbi:BRO-N domain-containing protein [Paracoccus sp. 22332]|uniref:BRO-N domain-containing protein n=1 Tax=Paracoccus sp. 22332 TaxID=3453913 RepID=UPI003F83E45F